MKLLNLFIITMVLTASACSTSKKWNAITARELASEESKELSRPSFHRLVTDWGEVVIRMGETLKDNKTAVTLEVINLTGEELKYKRDFFNFLSFDNTNINVIKEFDDQTLISEDDQSLWYSFSEKLIPLKPLQTRTIAGEANIKKGYFIRDTIYIDSKDLLRHDRLSVIISNEFLKSKGPINLEFTASK